MYEPFRSQSRFYKYKTSMPILKLKNVISILGCQTLYELRQKIICQSDLSVTKEISENPNKKSGLMAKVTILSIFTFIRFIAFYVFIAHKNCILFTIIGYLSIRIFLY